MLIMFSLLASDCCRFCSAHCTRMLQQPAIAEIWLMQLGTRRAATWIIQPNKVPESTLLSKLEVGYDIACLQLEISWQNDRSENKPSLL